MVRTKRNGDGTLQQPTTCGNEKAREEEEEQRAPARRGCCRMDRGGGRRLVLRTACQPETARWKGLESNDRELSRETCPIVKQHSHTRGFQLEFAIWWGGVGWGGASTIATTNFLISTYRFPFPFQAQPFPSRNSPPSLEGFPTPASLPCTAPDAPNHGSEHREPSRELSCVQAGPSETIMLLLASSPAESN